MFKFTDFVLEIWTISKEKHVPVDVAYDMFRADVAIGKATADNTGDTLPGFGFAAAKAAWTALTAEERVAAYASWHDVTGVLGAYSALSEAYPDRTSMTAAVAAAEVRIATKKAAKAADEEAAK